MEQEADQLFIAVAMSLFSIVVLANTSVGYVIAV